MVSLGSDEALVSGEGVTVGVKGGVTVTVVSEGLVSGFTAAVVSVVPVSTVISGSSDPT